MIQSVLCLMGPTASGKTDLVLELNRHLPLHIISVDSAMVYRGMDIGTAKPTRLQQLEAPHHLIDICDPKMAYSAGQFYQNALNEIQIAHQQNRIPLLVGGTMLYFHVLQQGFSDLPPANEAIRQQIQSEADVKGWPYLHQKLLEQDPKVGATIHPNDAQRIQRALELYELTHHSIKDLQTINRLPALPYEFINCIVAPEDRRLLHQRIDYRFRRMLVEGFIEEVSALYHRQDLHRDLPAIRTVGYRQVWDYLAGEYDQATMVDRAIFATRQLAKRQFTWLRRFDAARHLTSEHLNTPQFIDFIKLKFGGL